jgi:hypothetical protein
MKQRFLVAGAVLASFAAFGCAKSPTSILTVVSADPSTPPVLVLRTTVRQTGGAMLSSGAMQSSPTLSDAADRPGPYAFPFPLDLTVDATLAGPVTITIQGLDWDTYAAIAAGTTTAEVVAQQQTQASLTLFPAVAGSGDGGPQDGGAD